MTLEGVHICCNACVRAINEAVGDVEGATVACDRSAGTVAVTAPDLGTVQKAVDAIVEAGYEGTPDNDEVKIKDDSEAPEGKVKELTLGGAHNCCRACATAINDTLKEVDGVDAVKVEPKGAEVVVTGDFDAKAIVKALKDAGFHVHVKK